MNILPKRLLQAVFVLVFLLGSSALFAQTTQVFTTSGTFTVPPCVTSMTIQCFGAGGGGGGGAQQSGGSVGSGGGGGGYAISTLTNLSGTYTVTVGTGGSAGIGSNGAQGGAGGNSSVSNGTVSVTATGGARAALRLPRQVLPAPVAQVARVYLLAARVLPIQVVLVDWAITKMKILAAAAAAAQAAVAVVVRLYSQAQTRRLLVALVAQEHTQGAMAVTTYDDYYENGNPQVQAQVAVVAGGGGEVSGGLFGHGTASGNGGSGADGKVIISYTTSAPTISSISGTGCIGSTITVNGTLLAGTTSVTIGSTAVTNLTATNGTVTGTIALGTTSGVVTVVTPCGTIVSSVTFVVNPASPPVNLGNHYICPGSSYTFGGHTYSAAGTVFDTSRSLSGCDSITSITLIIASVINQSITQTICAGGSYAFGGNNLTAGGVYHDTTTAASTGCDSITTLLLSVTPNITAVATQTICANGSYNFGGRVLTSGGVYTDTTTSTVSGCDSITTLVLTVLPNPTTTDNHSICNGQSYLGHSIGGTYTDTFPGAGANGCDSLHVLNLTIAPYVMNNLNQSICSGQSYLGHSQAGTYTDTLPASSGCDTIRTLTLSIAPYITSTTSMTVCAGQTYQGHSQSGAYADTLPSSSGCDTIRTVNLTVLPSATSISSYSTCASSYQGHTTSGTYIDTLHGAATGGCDSIRVLQLTVGGSGLNSTVNHSICQGQVYRGSDSSTTFIDSLHSVGGCDSIVTTILTVVENYTLVQKLHICAGETYQGHDTAGTFVDSLHTIGGCDSVIILELQFNPLPGVPTIGQSGSTLTATADSGMVYSWQLNGDSIAGQHSATLPLTQIGNYTVIVTDSAGCSNTSTIFPVTSVGIAETALSGAIEIYPNPANGQFVLRSKGLVGKDIKLTVFDAVGVKVINTIYQTIGGQDIAININQLSQGIYMVQLQVEGVTVTKKLVVQ